MPSQTSGIGFMDVEKFESTEEARKAAIALKKYLKHYCSKTNSPIVCYIGISLHTSHCGFVKSGFRGKKEYIVGKDLTPLVYPHLHIAYLCNPNDQLGDVITEYYTERGRSISAPPFEIASLESAMTHTMRQSIKYIAVDENTENLPHNTLVKFLKLAEKLNRESNGNKPVFSRLPLSQKFFLADESELITTDYEVFTNQSSTKYSAIQNSTKLNQNRSDAINHYGKSSKHLKPTVPQNVIDGMVYFLNRVFPSDRMPIDTS